MENIRTLIFYTLKTTVQKPHKELMHMKRRKTKEYTEIYRTLYSMHIGLENTFARLYHIEDEIIPPLIKTCITMFYQLNTMHNTPLHVCFTEEKIHNWIPMRIAFALCGCGIKTVYTNSVKWEKIHVSSDGSVWRSEKPKKEIPISIRIPLYKNTYHICTSYSCSGTENIAIGLIEVSESIIQKLSFAYYSQQRVYILPLAESNFFIGKRYPISTHSLESFGKHILSQFQVIEDSIGVRHIAYVTEALIALLNPALA